MLCLPWHLPWLTFATERPSQHHGRLLMATAALTSNFSCTLVSREDSVVMLLLFFIKCKGSSWVRSFSSPVIVKLLLYPSKASSILFTVGIPGKTVGEAARQQTQVSRNQSEDRQMNSLSLLAQNSIPGIDQLYVSAFSICLGRFTRLPTGHVLKMG